MPPCCILAFVLWITAVSRLDEIEQNSAFELLEDGVFVASHFLSEQEVRHVLDLIESPAVGGWKPTSTGGADFAAPKMGESFLFAIRNDPVISRIEERIANATAIPIHPDEDVISFARIQNRAKSSARGGHFPPFGLHHETDTRPNRAKTVLVYLQAPREGGRTIFPLLGVPRGQRSRKLGGMDPALQQRHEELLDALSAQFGGPPDWKRQAQTPSPETEHPLMDLLEKSCRGKYGLSINPKAGMAVMWSHIDEHGKPNESMWHDGCNVVAGTKITLQKFKELPRSQRKFVDPSFIRYTPFRMHVPKIKRGTEDL